jgi:hypothetical protein
MSKPYTEETLPAIVKASRNAYAGRSGTFFKDLEGPWDGLHECVLDTIPDSKPIIELAMSVFFGGDYPEDDLPLARTLSAVSGIRFIISRPINLVESDFFEGAGHHFTSWLENPTGINPIPKLSHETMFLACALLYLQEKK